MRDIVNLLISKEYSCNGNKSNYQHVFGRYATIGANSSVMLASMI